MEAEGRKPTHDFLSLCSHSRVQQDPRPSSQGGYLKTHDFLHLEQLGKACAKEETPLEEAMAEKPAPPAPPPRSAEHTLPGGIGTYSISHISYKTEGPLFTSVAQRSSSERNEETSNCSSYTGSGFTLWEESAASKGKTGKENTGGKTPDLRGKERQWATSSLERASQSSTNNHHNNSFSSLSSSRPSSKQKSFMEMITLAKGSAQYDDFEEDEDFILRKQSSTTSHSKGELRVKVDRKNPTDQKANTPRSKHSATEQRRRSKINDRQLPNYDTKTQQFFCRFQMLRGIIPNSDQKRDKASFLLEVIEYIQFLQEKVEKYEGAYQGWNHEPSKLMPWSNKERPTEDYADQSRHIHGMSTPALRAVDLGSVMMNKAMPFLVSPPQPNLVTLAQSTPRLPSDAETNGALPVKKQKEKELTVEGGTISISSIYSQRLLNTLTQALKTSGVDLSHASISVQIDLGKQSSTLGGRETPSTNQGTAHSRVGFIEDSDPPIKKLKA
ncbi:hypothetical protein V6N13_060912 [Hibiscus sabdariffa]